MKVVHRLNASGNTVEVELKDWRGTPIDVGSIVLYPTKSGAGSATLTEAVVTSIKVDNKRYGPIHTANYLDAKMQSEGYDDEIYQRMIKCLETAWKIKVKRTNKPGGFGAWEEPDRIITLQTANESVAVIG